jgi:IclR family transcriptional regulator, pca regulon regulatory protein
VNDEELAYGLRSIAAPVNSQSGEVVAALNLSVHRTMVSRDELIARFAPVVLKTAHDISLGMGHRVAPA